jgi:enamine deaminase RidA (YjgF/YER057c/UK114 family)
MEREYINPTGVFQHPGFTRVVTVKGPMKIVFIAGQTPSDENYDPVSPGNWKAQYIQVMKNLDVQLKAAGATWDDVVFRRVYVLDVDEFLKIARDPDIPRFGDPNKPPPSTLIGVTRLSKPEFLLEIEILAITAA